MSFDMSICVES